RHEKAADESQERDGRQSDEEEERDVLDCRAARGQPRCPPTNHSYPHHTRLMTSKGVPCWKATVEAGCECGSPPTAWRRGADAAAARGFGWCQLTGRAPSHPAASPPNSRMLRPRVRPSAASGSPSAVQRARASTDPMPARSGARCRLLLPRCDAPVSLAAPPPSQSTRRWSDRIPQSPGSELPLRVLRRDDALAIPSACDFWTRRLAPPDKRAPTPPSLRALSAPAGASPRAVRAGRRSPPESPRTPVWPSHARS